MRWTGHIEDVEAGKHTNEEMQEIYNEYGCEDWIFEELLVLHSDDKYYICLVEGHMIHNHPNVINVRNKDDDRLYGGTGKPKGKKKGSSSIGDRYEIEGMVLYEEYFDTRQEFLAARISLRQKVQYLHWLEGKGIPGSAYEQDLEKKRSKNKRDYQTKLESKGIPGGAYDRDRKSQNKYEQDKRDLKKLKEELNEGSSFFKRER